MINSIDSFDDLITLLKRILAVTEGRGRMIRAFQQCLFDSATPISGATEDQWDILHDLATDLDYYDPDAVRHREDPAFYDEDRLVTEIQDALKRLDQIPRT